MDFFLRAERCPRSPKRRTDGRAEPCCVEVESPIRSALIVNIELSFPRKREFSFVFCAVGSQVRIPASAGMTMAIRRHRKWLEEFVEKRGRLLRNADDL